MTRRERMEAKIEKRLERAAGHRDKGAALEKRNEPYRGDYAFNTQPGHIPERARVIRREDEAMEHRQTAAHHEERAAGLETQLETSVFSDDPNAVEALEARIAEREAEAERKAGWNSAWKRGAAAAEKKAKAAGLTGEDLIVARLDGGDEALRAAGAPRAIILAASETMEQRYSWVKAPFDLTHLRASIRQDRSASPRSRRDRRGRPRRRRRAASSSAAGSTYRSASRSTPAGRLSRR